MFVTANANNYPGPGMVVLIGVVVVFSVLLLLTFVFWLFGKVAGNNKPPKTPAAKPAPVAVAPTPAPVAAPITEGVPEEVVAVIAAAVAAMSSDGTHYAIRRIRPATANGNRSVWAAAGVAENTRPF